MRIYIPLLFFVFFINASKAQVKTGADQIEEYLDELKGKRVGLLVNQTSIVSNNHLVDTLLSLGVKITKVFAPEHGFRGKNDAGEHVSDQKDAKTGLPIVSLYGKNKKPSKAVLENVDIIIYDIQDVGVRFYTYISSMYYMMEACAKHGKEFIVLDRPNPNIDRIEGPILDTAKHRSFVGLLPLPIVYGMSAGELAKMIIGESWITTALQIKIVPCKNYTRSTIYKLPIAPSPNLPSYTSVRLYPSLCLFEPTTISIGRGTYTPFEMYGAPYLDINEHTYSFTPMSIDGMSKHPKHENKICYGVKLDSNSSLMNRFTPSLFTTIREKAPENFITNPAFLKLLIGADYYYDYLIGKKKYTDIYQSYETELADFKKQSEKYYLYK